MAMIVQHNLTAMNSNRQLGVTTSSQAKSSEKLSSGYRINRAGDDAAGLKISEKMRSQVRGLNRASTNAQDGVSLIQTAEGALNEAHSILQRMNELAVQGANDTNENIDRQAINEELDQLTTELDRISQTTQFNKQNLLDGSFKEKNLQVGANTNQHIAITIGAMNASAIGIKGTQNAGYSFNGTNYSTKAGASAAVQAELAKIPEASTYILSNNATSYAVNDGTTAISFNTRASASAAATSIYNAKVSAVGAYKDNNLEVKGFTYAGASYKTQSAATAALDADKAKIATASQRVVALSDKATNVKYRVDGHTSIFTTSASAKSLATAEYDAAIASLGQVTSVTGTKLAATVSAPTVSTYEKAQVTLSRIQNAINNVSSQRSALGALQNRLEHTIANLDNVAENTQSAESRIRDTDMASEMVEYSKNNILAQAGQSMLAQANQSTQGVLSLLQ